MVGCVLLHIVQQYIQILNALRGVTGYCIIYTLKKVCKRLISSTCIIIKLLTKVCLG